MLFLSLSCNPTARPGLAVTYFTGGRFNPNKNAVPLDRADLVNSLVDQHETVPASRRSLSSAPLANSPMIAAKQTVPANSLTVIPMRATGDLPEEGNEEYHSGASDTALRSKIQRARTLLRDICCTVSSILTLSPGVHPGVQAASSAARLFLFQEASSWLADGKSQRPDCGWLYGRAHQGQTISFIWKRAWRRSCNSGIRASCTPQSSRITTDFWR